MGEDRTETRGDDRERFELLYRRHVASVLAFALARVSAEQAKDVTAETFLVAWRRLDDVPVEPAAWLFAVARNVIATQLRSEARREALGARLFFVAKRDPDGPDISAEIAEREAVLGAFTQLSEADQEVLRLVAWDGLTPDLAAAALGVTRTGFAVRLHRARRRLAAKLAAFELAQVPTGPDLGSNPSAPHRSTGSRFFTPKEAT